MNVEWEGLIPPLGLMRRQNAHSRFDPTSGEEEERGMDFLSVRGCVCSDERSLVHCQGQD